MDDLEISEDLRQRATIQVPEVPSPTPEELPDELAAALLWEIATESSNLKAWKTRKMSVVFRQDMFFEATLSQAEWAFDQEGVRRWMPTGGMVFVKLLNLDDAEGGTVESMTSMFTGAVTREEFIAKVAESAAELKSKYVMTELKKISR